MLVTGQREHAERLRQEVTTVLAPMGLRLSPEKTHVVHIDDGFDLLGFNIRRMRKRGSSKWFVYTRPSKKAIGSIKSRVKTMTYRSTLHKEPGYLMDYLGRVLRGGPTTSDTEYPRPRFSAIDSYAWERITAWLPKKHRIGWPELRQVLPARNLAARRRRDKVQGRSQRHCHPVPLPRLPDSDPVDTCSPNRLSDNPHVESPVR
ncbi:hypothetical protein KNN17_21110 [Arthrobacter bambusae]|nr:hypothetical protein [Arthrobacter bambusae]